MKIKHVFRLLLVLAVLAGGAWLYFTPHIALAKIRAAAERGDRERLNELVDFASLRASVRDNVSGSVRGKVASVAGRHAGAVGGFVASRAVGPAVDLAVSPAGVAALARGRDPGEKDDGRARRTKLDGDYEGAHKFVMHFIDRESGNERLAVVMRRAGLFGWRLTGVRVPGAR
ncbi:MAG TPA: DUF2939 domain-containing protein [Longimicrobium sp.]|nr:DUF2939 domain-containing protein [Longimicrobium sp.]